MTRDPNLSKVELIAAALGPLCDQLVFVGGCAVGLLITDAAAAPVRVTYDVILWRESPPSRPITELRRSLSGWASVEILRVMLQSVAGDIALLKLT